MKSSLVCLLLLSVVCTARVINKLFLIHNSIYQLISRFFILVWQRLVFLILTWAACSKLSTMDSKIILIECRKISKTVSNHLVDSLIWRMESQQLCLKVVLSSLWCQKMVSRQHTPFQIKNKILSLMAQESIMSWYDLVQTTKLTSPNTQQEHISSISKDTTAN